MDLKAKSFISRENNMTKLEKRNILEKVILFQDKIYNLKILLNRLPWDSKEDIFIINKSTLLQILQKFLDENTNIQEIEEWANLLECREDIGYTNSCLKDIIDEFANPIVYGDISLKKINDKINTLRNSSD